MHCNVEGDLLRFSERADLAFTVLTAFNPAEPEAVTCMTDTNRPYLNRVIGHWPGQESQGSVCLPGGVGTLDETFELLTLTQTGKGMPVPIVLLDEPGDPYWEAVDGLMQQLVRRGLESAGDTALYTITDSCDEAWRIIDEFYANYDSIRFVGDHMVMRMQHGPTDAQLADLNERYGHFIVDGTIHRAEPYKIEVRDNDKLDLERIAFHFTRHGYDDIIRLIGDINSYVT